jgi:hypothetical protein
MDEDVTDPTAGASQSGPAAAAGGDTVIEAFPGEYFARRCMPRPEGAAVVSLGANRHRTACEEIGVG